MSQPASSEAPHAEIIGRVHTDEMIPVDVTDPPFDQECSVDHNDLGSTEFLILADFANKLTDQSRMDDSIQGPYACRAGERPAREDGSVYGTRLDDVPAKLPGQPAANPRGFIDNPVPDLISRHHNCPPVGEKARDRTFAGADSSGHTDHRYVALGTSCRHDD